MNDVIDYIDGNIDYGDFNTLEELEDYIYENAYDEITGTTDGSHTYSRSKALENLSNNFDLLAEALNNFCLGVDFIANGEEMCDVLIRQYVLSQAIHEAVQEVEVYFEAYKNEEESEEDIA